MGFGPLYKQLERAALAPSAMQGYCEKMTIHEEVGLPQTPDLPML